MESVTIFVESCGTCLMHYRTIRVSNQKPIIRCEQEPAVLEEGNFKGISEHCPLKTKMYKITVKS